MTAAMRGLGSFFCVLLVGCVASSPDDVIQQADSSPDAGILGLGTKVTIYPGLQSATPYLRQTSGGDTDTQLVYVGHPFMERVARTGNHVALPASDGNLVKDDYLQIDVTPSALYRGSPTPSVLLEVTYLDSGTDGLAVEYDGTAGPFAATHRVYKTNSGRWKTAAFVIKDAFFGDRDNGADLRIDDLGDGAETIRAVSLTLLPVPHVLSADQCGANPFDSANDSSAIQACIDSMVDGDTLLFTSPGQNPLYKGYQIDRTLFAVRAAEGRRYLTFTSTNPADPAYLVATAGLKGFVMKLLARSSVTQQGAVDDIAFAHLHLDGNRALRKCLGANGVPDGLDDNWGSWLAHECDVTGDSWCTAGTLDLAGGINWADPAQAYETQPDDWSENIVADGLIITNTECGTAFGMEGAGNTIVNTVVQVAGDHVHVGGCAETDADGDGIGDWSDGLTIAGPGHLIFANQIIDPSDIGIVFFGGRETIIRQNTVHTFSGNHGAFAGIAIHPWALGDSSNDEVILNTVVNEGDVHCGGIHAGIDIGAHMWGGGCSPTSPAAVGNGTCTDEPAAPHGALCPATGNCQRWAEVPSGAALVLRDNQVTGAHVNYLIEGVEGSISESGNASVTPRGTDWQSASGGCNGVTWSPTDKIAHHPTLTGWTQKRVHCER